MSARIRTLIVDDEPLARERIRTLLERDDSMEVVGECTNGVDAVRALSALAPDLVFLDVQMPELDGFGVIEALRGQPLPAIIFVTAYDRYALRAFDVHALDYLLKPFDRERFERALERARRQLQGGPSQDLQQRLLDLLRDVQIAPGYLERLVIKSSGRVTFLKTADIHWIEAQGNYVQLHAGPESYLLRETMSSLEKRLDPKCFLRVHRSAMVNLEHVREMRPLFHGDYTILMRDGHDLTSGRGFRDKLQRLITTHGV